MLKKKKKGMMEKKNLSLPGPGFEPGLLRPQRSVLTTRRSRLAMTRTADSQGKFYILKYHT